MVGIIDYGAGNLYSVEKAVAKYADVVVSGDAAVLEKADKLLLPGVGEFGACMRSLRAAKLIPFIMDSITKKELLGICVGMQILFEGSEESPSEKGLGIFKGTVKKIDSKGLKIPHMAWNSLEFPESRHKLFNSLAPTPYVYYVHSYHAVPDDASLILATSNYGENVTAAVGKGNIVATQFHPEKSGDVGLKIIENFVKG